MADVARNRQASYRYHLLEKWECGLVLQGSEVKSLRQGQAQLKDAYATVNDGEVWLHNMHIAPYAPAARENHDPERSRKLLMHRREIRLGDPLEIRVDNLEPARGRVDLLLADAPERPRKREQRR